MTTRNEETTVWIPCKKLVYDPEVNTRPLSERRVQEMVDDFDVEALGVLDVAPRGNGMYTVIDGQHRNEVVKRALGEDQRVECKIHKRITQARQADLFVKRNASAKVGPLYEFLASVKAGHDEATAIAGICEEVGLKVTNYQGDGTIRCVSTLRQIYRGGSMSGKSQHPKALQETLAVCTKAWGLTSEAVQGDAVMGIGLVILRYGDQLDLESLTKKLASLPGGANGLIARGKSIAGIHGTRIGRGVASIVVEIYNKGRRAGAIASWWT